MKTLQSLLLLALTATVNLASVQAQSTDETQKEIISIPESYQSIQEQLEPDASAGTSTYNIAENETPVDPGAADWRSEGEMEELRIYSGSHDGNNLVRTVKVPVRKPDAYSSRSEYRPE